MPRAKRYYVPGGVWHLTHRCHNRDYLLKFQFDRARWRYWLFEARKRYGLTVLNYVATSNHVHLLVLDRKPGSIARSMQLISGRVAQEFNQRKARKGAFWEDRYFATAVSTDHHLIRCLVYIDLNMVRAGVARHPAEWRDGGYLEIQSPPMRYRIIDVAALCRLTGFTTAQTLRRHHRKWVLDALRSGKLEREPRWTEAVAVGPDSFTARFSLKKSAS